MALRQFRTGYQDIPDHLDEIMPADTSNMTFDEAIQAANRRMEAAVIGQAHDDLVKQHFRTLEEPR